MTLVIENIESARLREGIDDVGLRKSVAQLKAEDRVRLSVSGDGKTFETVSVRITSRRGGAFRGKLITQPRSLGLKAFAAGAAVKFSIEQVHSIVACKGGTTSAPSECFSKVAADDDVDEDRGSLFVSVKRVKTKRPTATAAPRKRKLRVETNGARSFICVPVGSSNELHRYLRSHKIRSSPPQPYFSDFDCIELDRSIDLDTLQALLDTWRQLN